MSAQDTRLAQLRLDMEQIDREREREISRVRHALRYPDSLPRDDFMTPQGRRALEALHRQRREVRAIWTACAIGLVILILTT